MSTLACECLGGAHTRLDLPRRSHAQGLDFLEAVGGAEVAPRALGLEPFVDESGVLAVFRFGEQRIRAHHGRERRSLIAGFDQRTDRDSVDVGREQDRARARELERFRQQAVHVVRLRHPRSGKVSGLQYAVDTPAGEHAHHDDVHVPLWGQAPGRGEVVRCEFGRHGALILGFHDGLQPRLRAHVVQQLDETGAHRLRGRHLAFHAVGGTLVASGGLAGGPHDEVQAGLPEQAARWAVADAHDRRFVGRIGLAGERETRKRDVRVVVAHRVAEASAPDRGADLSRGREHLAAQKNSPVGVRDRVDGFDADRPRTCDGDSDRGIAVAPEPDPDGPGAAGHQ